MKLKKKKFCRALLLLCLAGLLAVLALDLYVVLSTEGRIDVAFDKDEADCALVLGCGVKEDGRLSDMLRDRMDTAIALYKEGRVDKLLLSGDHGRADYDEVNAMLRYALDAGLPSEDLFTDHAGFSTYESVYRARDVFCADNIVIVTQRYHLCRALFLADALGVEAVGVSADRHTYRGQLLREAREVAARCKDVWFGLTKPLPAYLGEAIPVSGSGEASRG